MVIFILVSIALVSFILINIFFEGEKNANVEIKLNLVSEANGDFSKLRSDYHNAMTKEGQNRILRDDIRWFYQATSESQFKKLQQYFEFEFSHVSFEDKYVVISIGSPLVRLTYNENHKCTEYTKSGEKYYEYFVSPRFNEEIYNEGKIYVYTMSEILFVDNNMDFDYWNGLDISENSDVQENDISIKYRLVE